MDGLLLLTGHLIGDYIVQNDWMAKWKVRWGDVSEGVKQYDRVNFTGHVACTVHCLLYTLAVWVCSFWWMPWWGLVACFALHWSIDRFRLARKWMEHVSGQKEFATGPLSPWSIIIVDNVIHVATLAVIGKVATL